VVSKAESVEFFLRRGYPRVVYTEERVDGGAYLKEPVKTRWGSKVDLLLSLIENRVSVEHTLGRLRREKFRSPEFDAMGWIWLNSTWDDWEQVLKVGTYVRNFIMVAQGDECTLGESVHHYLLCRQQVERFA
jgi:hypothetical protein